MNPKNLTEEPAPPESAADGTQKKETRENSVVELYQPIESKMGSSAFQDAIERISQTYPRSLGGEIGAALIAAATKHLTYELHEKKAELHEVRGHANSLRDQVAQKDVTIAVQQEKIENLSRGRHFRYLLLTFGTALLGFAVEFFRNQMPPYAFSCAFIGAVIILGTWLSSPKGGAK